MICIIIIVVVFIAIFGYFQPEKFPRWWRYILIVLLLVLVFILLISERCIDLNDSVCINSKSMFTFTLGDEINLYSGKSVIQTSDGGYILGGSSNENGDEDALLVKLDKCGREEWTNLIGGTGKDGANNVNQTLDGGYIFTGYYNQETYLLGYFWVVKTDDNGNVVWENTYNNGGQYTGGLSIEQANDGGYIIVGQGETGGGGLIIKTDSEGNEIWRNVYVSNNISFIEDFVELSSGDIILCGWMAGNGAGILVKLDAEGNEVWSKIYWYPIPISDLQGDYYIKALEQTNDNGFILTGEVVRYDNSRNAIIVKVNGTGEVQWTKIYEYGIESIGYSILQTSDDGFIVGGRYGDSSFILKTNSSGEEEWIRHFDTPNPDVIYEINSTFDGGYCISGTSSYTSNYAESGKAWMIKTDELGNTIY